MEEQSKKIWMSFDEWVAEQEHFTILEHRWMLRKFCGIEASYEQAKENLDKIRKKNEI